MKKILALVLAAAMVFSLLAVTASADIKDTAKELKVGGSVSGKVTSNAKTADYKVTVNGTGTLKLTLEVNDRAYISVFDADDRYIKPTGDTEMIQGKYQNDKSSEFVTPDSTLKKAKIVFTYDVKKGTYYIRIARTVAYGDATFKLSAATSGMSSSTELMVRFNVEVGKRITIATTAGAGADISWKSSNKSIATVNSNGRVTGVQAGNATITATDNDTGEQIKIRIRVID